MRQKFIVGNWKMHTTTAEARQLAKAIVAAWVLRIASRSPSVRLFPI